MSNEPWVIIVGNEPREPDGREMLELILAGATLEVEMVVVFEGAGCAHLEPEVFAPWRQLVDFELARVHARRPSGTLLPSGVSTIDDVALERCCRDSAGVLRL